MKVEITLGTACAIACFIGLTNYYTENRCIVTIMH